MGYLHLICCSHCTAAVFHEDYRKSLSHLNFYQFATNRILNWSWEPTPLDLTFPIYFFECSISEASYTEGWWWWKFKLFTKFCNLSLIASSVMNQACFSIFTSITMNMISKILTKKSTTEWDYHFDLAHNVIQ